MRISDWSSDVCSSDLAGTGERARGAGERTQRGTHVVTADGATPAAELPLSPLHMLLILGLMVLWGVNFAVAKVGLEQLPPMLFMALRFALVAIQIGRASCRDRVRQYVEISGVPVSLKKKKEHSPIT